MPCPYLERCKEKVTRSYYEQFCKANYWLCDTYEKLSEEEEKFKTPAEWKAEE